MREWRQLLPAGGSIIRWRRRARRAAPAAAATRAMHDAPAPLAPTSSLASSADAPELSAKRSTARPTSDDHRRARELETELRKAHRIETRAQVGNIFAML